MIHSKSVKDVHFPRLLDYYHSLMYSKADVYQIYRYTS